MYHCSKFSGSKVLEIEISDEPIADAVALATGLSISWITNRKPTQRSQRDAASLESVSLAKNNLVAGRLGFLKHNTWSPE